MSLAPEYRYTDRDVRADESLTDLAIAYLRAYTGEFEPLLEAKELYEEDGELPVAIVRRVLNCMRHDARVAADLPRPKGDNVLSFEKPRSKKKIQRGDKQCDNKNPHYMHSWGEHYENACEGIPWPINRGEVRLPVKVHVPYAASRTGKLIHDLDQTGEHKHWGIWHGPPHAWGFRSQEFSHYKSDADLHVKLACKYPSYLRNPILIKAEELDKYMEIEDVLSGLRHMSMCPHCAAVRR